MREWWPVTSCISATALIKAYTLHALASLCSHTASLHRGCRYGLQVQALDSLAKALHVEVLELRRERARALSSRGLWGHFKNLLGYLLSVYCLLKSAIIPWLLALLLSPV